MKKGLALLNLVLLLSIASSVVFPALHSFEHIATDYSAHKCIHKQEGGKAQITHEHSHLDHCYICGFSFSNFVEPSIFSFEFSAAAFEPPYFLSAPQIHTLSTARTHPSRGPPTV